MLGCSLVAALASVAWGAGFPAMDGAGSAAYPQRIEIASSRGRDGSVELLLEVLGRANASGARQRLVRLSTRERDGSQRQSEWLEGRPVSMSILRLAPGSPQKEWIHTVPKKGAGTRGWPTRSKEELKRAYSRHLEASDFTTIETVETDAKAERHVVQRRGPDGKFKVVRRFEIPNGPSH